MTARGWGYSSCVFSVQMFPLSLPNDLDIKSCRFPVVNLPRGTPGTCTAWLRLRPTPTSQNWHKISSQKNKHLDSIPYNNLKLRCSVLELERSWQEGSGSLDYIIPLLVDGADCFPSSLPSVCITSSLVWFWHFVNIFEFHFWRCDEWDEFDHIWFCRRQCKYLQGSPCQSPIRSHCPGELESHNSVVSVSIWLHICCWAWVRFMLDTSAVSEPPGLTHSHLSHVSWSPELDTGSLPKWDNGNYRTLTNISSYRKLQTQTLKERYVALTLGKIQKDANGIKSPFVKWNRIFWILDYFHSFVVTKFLAEFLWSNEAWQHGLAKIHG